MSSEIKQRIELKEEKEKLQRAYIFNLPLVLSKAYHRKLQ
jgi:hypothetical protein